MINKILKYTIVVLSLSLLIFFYFVGRKETSPGISTGLASKIKWDKQNLPLIPVAQGNWKPQINSSSYILLDADTSIVLIEKESDRKASIASTTKVMTAILTLQELSLDQKIVIPKEISKVTGSLINLRTGEEIKVSDLLDGMMMQSGNDAAFTLGYAIGQKNGKTNYDEAIAFAVNLMNQKAKDLNLTNTAYADPAGLDTYSQSTAADLAHLSAYAMKNPVFSKVIAQTEKDIYSTDGTIMHHLKNSNRLLHSDDIYYPYAIGVKTGFTNEAGHCLIGAAKKNDHILVSVVLSTFDSTLTASAIESRKLLSWGFDNFEWK